MTFGKKSPAFVRIIYIKTCEGGHRSKLTICHSWPHVHGTSISLWSCIVITPYLGHLFLFNLEHGLILLLLFLYHSSVLILAELKSCVVFVSYYEFEILIHQQKYCCPLNLHPFSTSTDNTLELMVVTDYCTHSSTGSSNCRTALHSDL